VTIEAHRPPARASSTALMTLLVCASLALNIFLAAKVLHRKPSLPSAAATAHAHPNGELVPPVPILTNQPLEPVLTNAPLPFLWSQVESADYRQYIANLRAVGCPEAIIRDIITADINQLYKSRVAAIWKPEIREYWQKSTGNNANPDQELKLMALSREKSLVLRDLLGIRLNDQQMIDTVHMQLYGSERDLLFLPADKREAALQALADADFEMSAEKLRARYGLSSRMDKKHFEETLQTLANVLSPSELEEFQLRGSPAAKSLREEVRYFDCSPGELKQLLDSREHAGDKNQGDLLNRTAATEEVRKLFGDERAKDFERVTDLLYINTRRAAEEQGVSLELIEQAWQVTHDTRNAASSVAKNSSLSAAERAAQLQTLQDQSAKRLNEVLGSKAAFGVMRDLKVLINAKPPP
jgi:hypothetical protein